MSYSKTSVIYKTYYTLSIEQKHWPRFCLKLTYECRHFVGAN